MSATAFFAALPFFGFALFTYLILRRADRTGQIRGVDKYDPKHVVQRDQAPGLFETLRRKHVFAVWAWFVGGIFMLVVISLGAG
ncbi:MAG: hypothetical protein WC809_17690 [Sinimarinibacterium sp.]|jgi:hypothetical protein